MKLIASILFVLLLAAQSWAAGYRTKNFTVDAPTAALAKEIGDKAEFWRIEMAKWWTGKAMPPWSKPCPIHATVAPNIGAGGATSFVFDRGQVFNWRMKIQGSRELILDAVLPHEVSHTVFACYFRAPIPRWIDEGACSTVEIPSEVARHERNLIEFLKTGRGIPFSQMLAMKEYPPDVMPLYSQGHSVCRWLIDKHGREAFMAFVKDGMSDDNWLRAINKAYGFETVLAMQTEWNQWVKQERQPKPASPPVQVASLKTPIADLFSATVKLELHYTDGTTRFDVATATVVDGRDGGCLALTCGHLFRDTAGKGRVVAIFRGGRKAPATLLKYDLKRDLATVVIHAKPLAIANVAEYGTPQSRGDKAIQMGCSNGNSPTAKNVIVTSINRYQGPPNIETTVASVEGRSGGGLFNEAGELIGVCYAADYNEDRTLYASLESIHAFMTHIPLETVKRCKRVWDACRGGWVEVCYDDGQPAQQQVPQQQIADPNPPTFAISGPVEKDDPAPVAEQKPCECAEKWAALEARLEKIDTSAMNAEKLAEILRLEVAKIIRANDAASPVDVDARASAAATAAVNQWFVEHPQPTAPSGPTAAEVAAEINKTRKPPRIRIKDPNGDKFTTGFAELHDNTEHDLILDLRFVSPPSGNTP